MFNKKVVLYINKNESLVFLKNNLKTEEKIKLPSVRELEKFKATFTKLINDKNIDTVSIIFGDDFSYVVDKTPVVSDFDSKLSVLSKIVPEEKQDLAFFEHDKNAFVYESRTYHDLVGYFKDIDIEIQAIAPLTVLTNLSLTTAPDAFILINANLELTISYYNQTKIIFSKKTSKENLAKDLKTTLENIAINGNKKPNKLLLCGGIKIGIKDFESISFDYDPVALVAQTNFKIVEEQKSFFSSYGKNFKKPSNTIIFGIISILILLITLVILMK